MASNVRILTRLTTAAKPSIRAPATRHISSRPNAHFSSRRAYATGPGGTQNSNRTFLYIGVGSIVAAGAGALIYTKQGANASGSAPVTKQSSDAGKTNAPAAFVPQKEDYQQVYNAIAKRLNEKEDYDDGSYGPVMVRLAWHCSGTYDKETGTGGSNGATMRFAPEGDHGANAGLKAARDFMEPVKAQFPWITYSDLWTLGGVCAIQEMQGPTIPWRPGRQDRDIGMCTPDGRLPDGSKEQSHLRAIFGRMGFDDREIVALSGAHALGRCHTDRSGFEGPWSFSPTIMSNDYYRLLMDEKWGWRKWNGPKQYEDASTKTLMMLPTDMALIKDKEFRKHVERYAKDDQVFFNEFRDVFCKLLELGVPFQSKEEDRITLTPLET